MLYWEISTDNITWTVIVFNVNALWAPATKVRQNLSIVAKNENSTEHFVHLHADTLCELN